MSNVLLELSATEIKAYRNQIKLYNGGILGAIMVVLCVTLVVGC